MTGFKQKVQVLFISVRLDAKRPKYGKWNFNFQK